MKLRDLRYIFHAELDPIYGTDEVESFFYMLTEHYLKVKRIQLATNPEFSIEYNMNIKMNKALLELKKERPISISLGKLHFVD